jgi:hypothetical protein
MEQGMAARQRINAILKELYGRTVSDEDILLLEEAQNLMHKVTW